VAPDATIQSFEPSPATFAKLKENHAKMRWRDVQIWNSGVGSEDSTLMLLEHEQSVMSSFLKPGALLGGSLVGSVVVPVVTLDSFVAAQHIPFVHVLKSDTQGFESEVFKGANGLFRENRVGMLLFEAIVSEQYEGIAPFHTVLRYLMERDFRIVALYNQRFQRGLLSWFDVLMVNAQFYRDTQASSHRHDRHAG
jgi:FkbM family methyltransferase